MISIELQTGGFKGVALYEGKGASLAAIWSHNLVDDAAEPPLQQRPVVFGSVPYLTERGTFVHNGTEFGLANQLRLLPGVFTRRKSNEELETHVNVAKGLGHRIQLDPATGIYKLNIAQSSLPLLPILKAMGVNDSAIKEAWGDELFYQNSAKSAGPAVRKLYEKLYRGAPPDGTNLEQSITDAFEKMTLDPEVTKRTLGQPFDRVNRDALMAITRKLRAVNTGAEDPDDRDAMAYQRLVGPEDLFAESVSQAGGRLRQLLWKSTPRGNLTAAQSRMLDDSIQGTILRTGLGAPLEMVNMAELLDAPLAFTLLGRGWMPCFSEDTEVLTLTGWKQWPAITTQDRLGCRVKGRLEFHQAEALNSVHYAGDMYCGSTSRANYCVSPSHRLYVSQLTCGKNKRQYRREYGYRMASAVHGKMAWHLIASDPYLGGESPSTFDIPPAPIQGQNAANSRRTPHTVNMLDWAEFMGAYLADGSYRYNTSRPEYKTEIAKYIDCNPEEHRQIHDLLSRIGFSFHYRRGRQFIISGKHLAYYVKQFGKSWDKSVPDYIMSGGFEIRKRFFDTITTMDRSNMHWSNSSFMYSSASQQLAEQVGWLGLSLGYAATYYNSQKPDERRMYHVVFRTAVETTISRQKSKTQYSICTYSGNLYSALVPGGLLITRRNGKTFWTGSSADSIPIEHGST